MGKALGGRHCVRRKKDFEAKKLTGNGSSDLRDDPGRSSCNFVLDRMASLSAGSLGIALSYLPGSDGGWTWWPKGECLAVLI